VDCDRPDTSNAQARQIDGHPWEGIGGVKAKSILGTSAGRCIGASLIREQTEAVWLMEGTPDLLAAPILAKAAGLDVNKLAFVCMTDTGNGLHAEDLPLLCRKAGSYRGSQRCRAWARRKGSDSMGGTTPEGRRRAGKRFQFCSARCKDLSDYLAAAGHAKAQRAEGEEKVAEAETTGEEVRRASDDGDSLNSPPNTANGSVPSELCPKSWAARYHCADWRPYRTGCGLFVAGVYPRANRNGRGRVNTTRASGRPLRRSAK